MEKEQCMVSVLCAAFNHEKYIADALESFVTQKTDFPIEILVNDDASTDGTADIIRRYEAKYPGLIKPVYQKENQYSQGVNIYESLFIPRARGKYLAYCEGDDYWTDPEKLRLQVEFMETHPEYSACVHNTLRHFCDGSRQDRLFIPAGEDRDLSFAQAVKGMGGAYHTSSLLARRELMTEFPDFYHIAMAHGFGDYPDALRLLLKGPIRFMERSMSVYRVFSGSGSWSAKTGGQYDRLKEFVTGEREMLLALLPQLDPEQAAQTRRVILEREYELMDIEGRTAEQLQPPYLEIYRGKSPSYKLKHFIKRRLPGLHRLYRRHRGYGDL